MSSRVIFLGKVDNFTLANVYRGAMMLLFPSLYEGFGLPVIEAMSCGIPVITSNTTSLVEVSGDAACLVSPDNETEIIQAINKVYKNQSYRDSLVRKGTERAAKYSWDNARQIVTEEINKLLK